MNALLFPWVKMTAHAIAAPIAVTAQCGKRITAVSKVLSRIALWMLTEHAAEHPACDREIRRAEKYPRNTNRRVSSETGKDADRQRARPSFGFEQKAKDPFDYQI